MQVTLFERKVTDLTAVRGMYTNLLGEHVTWSRL